MVDTRPNPSDRYALVSSLYGPGTIACWYLTMVSILVSWTMHPKKRKSGSIDVDLVAILTLPAVAAGHLISQVSTLINQHSKSPKSDTSADRYEQSIAAIEAPFSVIESFMAISVVLFLIAVWAFCLRRAITVAVIGLVCLGAECYIHFSNFKDLGFRYKPSKRSSDAGPAFGRSFVADFAGLVTAILAILALCAVTASLAATFLFQTRKQHRTVEGAEQGRSIELVAASRQRHLESSTAMPTTDRPTVPRGIAAVPPSPSTQSAIEIRRHARRRARKTDDDRVNNRIFGASAWISLALLPATMILSILPSAANAVQLGAYFLSTTRTTGSVGNSNTSADANDDITTITLWTRLKVFAAHFYPQSANSFSDLDQAVALAAGATVLGFSIYSVARARIAGEGGASGSGEGDGDGDGDGDRVGGPR